MNRLYFYIFFGLIIFSAGYAQYNQSSPANWLFPEGNSEATKYQSVQSDAQDLSKFVVKWSSNAISGDVQPLVGNIINNSKLAQSFPYAPNEIAAVVGGRIVVIDAYGKTRGLSNFQIPYIKNISVIFDTLQTALNAPTNNPVVMGIETSEFINTKDSVAYAYIAGYNNFADTVALLKRLAIDLKKTFRNYYASIKPVWGKKTGNNYNVYSVVNITNPHDDTTETPAYFRGLADFSSSNRFLNYPMPDMGDSELYRVLVAPDVNFAQPSLGVFNNKTSIYLPFYPIESAHKDLSVSFANNVTTASPTFPYLPYFAGYELRNSGIYQQTGPRDLSYLNNTGGKRPQFRPYMMHIKNAATGDSLYVLLAEQYKGTDSSTGLARLHLFNRNGDSVTYVDNAGLPAFRGTKDQLWSIAVGNVDGYNPVNILKPWYPQYPGLEIIATQSTRDFAVAQSKLMVLRYSTNNIPKPSPPNTYLLPFDTVATQRINGWVAAVNNLDGNTDGKDQIVLVDGSNLKILKMKDYTDVSFQSGVPFDTIYTIDFKNETISGVEIADIEGDGKNDLIVTTFNRTYLIGSVLPANIQVIHDPLPAMPICPGDTFNIRWRNVKAGPFDSRNYGKVNIRFVSYLGAIPQSDTLTFAESLDNATDTLSYTFTVPKELGGKTGRFIVQSSQYPGIFYDSTDFYSFAIPEFNVEFISPVVVTVGNSFVVNGSYICIDNFELQFSEDSLSWSPLSSIKTNGTGNYSFNAVMPCLNVFKCEQRDADSTLYLRVIAKSKISTDTSKLYKITAIPQSFPVKIEPSVNFSWDIAAFPFACDSIKFLISKDNGLTFSLLATLNSKAAKYEWNVPLDLPDPLLARFCCDGSCERLDTILRDYKPKNLGLLTPNPFNPEKEELQFCYQVTENTRVSIKIFDENNRLVAQPITSEDRYPKTGYCDSWKGTTSNNSYVANGLYYLVLEYSGGKKEVYPVYVKR